MNSTPLAAETDAAPSVRAAPNGPTCFTRQTARRLLLGVCLVGSLSAALGSQIIQRTREFFPVPPLPAELAAKIQPFQPIPPEVNEAVNALGAGAAYQNTALSLATVAAFALPLLGIIAGLITCTRFGPLRGGLAGLLLGIPLGGLAGASGVLIVTRLGPLMSEGDPMIPMTLAHAVTWLVFAVGTSITLGFSTAVFPAGLRNHLPKMLVGAAAGACTAAVLYPIAAMVLSPMSQSEVLLPSGTALSTLFVGLGVTVTGLAVTYAMTSSVAGGVENATSYRSSPVAPPATGS
jgi:hypothetical protein